MIENARVLGLPPASPLRDDYKCAWVKKCGAESVLGSSPYLCIDLVGLVGSGNTCECKGRLGDMEINDRTPP